MSIVTLPLPNQIVPGQLADAGPVMANMNYIAAQVNANAQAVHVPYTDLVAFGSAVNLSSGAYVATSFVSPVNDVLGEIAGGVFTPSQAGTYVLTGDMNWTTAGTTTSIALAICAVSTFVNGGNVGNQNTGRWPYGDSTLGSFLTPYTAALTMNAGDVLSLQMFISGFAGVAPQGQVVAMSIRRIA